MTTVYHYFKSVRHLDIGNRKSDNTYPGWDISDVVLVPLRRDGGAEGAGGASAIFCLFCFRAGGEDAGCSGCSCSGVSWVRRDGAFLFLEADWGSVGFEVDGRGSTEGLSVPAASLAAERVILGGMRSCTSYPN